MSAPAGPTALELFERFRPKFSEVELKPIRWFRDYGTPTPKFGLQICRGGEEVPWHDKYTDCFVEVKEAALAVDFHYNPIAKASIHDQLSAVVAEVISSRLLINRTFKLSPSRPFAGLISQGHAISRKFQIDLIGDPISGFNLCGTGFNEGMSGYWGSFVPPDTPEGAAIVAAIEYERALYSEPRDIVSERKAAAVNFEKALAAVA